MSKTETVTMDIPDPLALLDATLLFVLQLFLAKHPELFNSSDAPGKVIPSTARRVLKAIDNLHEALQWYNDDLPGGRNDPTRDNDIPF